MFCVENGNLLPSLDRRNNARMAKPSGGGVKGSCSGAVSKIVIEPGEYCAADQCIAQSPREPHDTAYRTDRIPPINFAEPGRFSRGTFKHDEPLCQDEDPQPPEHRTGKSKGLYIEFHGGPPSKKKEGIVNFMKISPRGHHSPENAPLW